ncbi:AraC family transcriptional regulator [Aureimonas pseudogalii]|uniref:AraC-like DNA-binding protein n=1 Tax=Aureimonas pseudogalii TaxID=1744844 RepID=A0A7W6H5R6_9HYPH|nr:AraC family transcriptional regulator [Aureimonas pseudogalii]MBB3999077.1 AraC-like DNA-binding protein [Aureimonas pseudogalii]
MPKDLRTIIRPVPCATRGIEPMFARTTLTFARHFHDQFGIGVVLSGAHRSASGRGPVEAVRGDVITVNPGEVRDGAPIGGKVRSWAMLYLDPDRISKIALDLNEGRSADLELAYPVRTDPVAASLFRKMFRSLLWEPDPEATAETLILLADRLAVRGAGTDKGNGAPLGLRRAQQAIDDDPTARHSLEDLASVASIGRFRLIRGFAAQTGMTPHAYTVQRRLQLARRLLRCGQSIALASAKAGFADQSHMTRLFSRTYGMTPGTYVRARY